MAEPSTAGISVGLTNFAIRVLVHQHLVQAIFQFVDLSLLLFQLMFELKVFVMHN